MPSKSRLVLIDDHAVFRDGLAMIIQREADLSVVGQYEDGATALKEIVALKPEMAIVDISMEGLSGIDLTRSLRAKLPSLRILVLSMHKEFLYAERALRAGANGYIMKQESGKTLMAAIRHIVKGGTYVSEAVKELMLQSVRGPDSKTSVSLVGRLSDRELEIFQLIAKGQGTRQMADALNLSTRTVETHREHIREKLSLKNTFELIQCAVEWSVSKHP